MNPIKAIDARVTRDLTERFNRLPLEDRIAFVMVEQTMGRATPPPVPPKDVRPANVRRKSSLSPSQLVEPMVDYFQAKSPQMPHAANSDVAYVTRHVGVAKLVAGCRRLARVLVPAPPRAPARAPEARVRWSYHRLPEPPEAPRRNVFEVFGLK